MNTQEFSATCRGNIASILGHLRYIPTECVSDLVLRAWENGGLLEPGYNPDGTLSRLWLNVVAHQAAVTRLAHALASGSIFMKDIVQAALVHDAYKRREWETVEAAKQAREDPAAANRRSEITSEKFLRDLGFPREVVTFAHATGDIGLELMRSGEPTFAEKVVFYADCCVSNDQIVGYKQRFDDLLPHFQPGGRYEWANENFLKKYGRTHREMYDAVVIPIQEELASIAQFTGDPANLFMIAL